MASVESIFPVILSVWLFGYFAVHLRRLVVTKCARIFETDQLVHWAIIWIGIGGLGFRGLALYTLFEMRPAFEATSPWPPPYLAGLTLAVRTSITVTTRATGCSPVYPDRTRVRSLR